MQLWLRGGARADAHFIPSLRNPVMLSQIDAGAFHVPRPFTRHTGGFLCNVVARAKNKCLRIFRSLSETPPLTFRCSRLCSSYGWSLLIGRLFVQNSFVRTTARSWVRGCKF